MCYYCLSLRIRRITNLVVFRSRSQTFCGSLLEEFCAFLYHWHLYFYHLIHLQHYSGIYYLLRSSSSMFSAFFYWISSTGKNPLGMYFLALSTFLCSQLYLLFHTIQPTLQWSLTVYHIIPNLEITLTIIYFAQESAIWAGCDEKGSSLLPWCQLGKPIWD